jgi:hypothetical protein
VTCPVGGWRQAAAIKAEREAVRMRDFAMEATTMMEERVHPKLQEQAVRARTVRR